MPSRRSAGSGARLKPLHCLAIWPPPPLTVGICERDRCPNPLKVDRRPKARYILLDDLLVILVQKGDAPSKIGLASEICTCLSMWRDNLEHFGVLHPGSTYPS